MNIDINKNINNKIYWLLTVAALAFTLLLNFYNKISYCSLVFTFLALILNATSELYGNKKAMQSIIFAVIISFVLLFNFKYYIYNQLINGLMLASFLSVLVSAYVGLVVFTKLKLKYNFYLSNFISLAVYAIVDGAVMFLFFINLFSVNRAGSIFACEVAYKCVFALVACAALSMVAKITRLTSKA